MSFLHDALLLFFCFSLSFPSGTPLVRVYPINNTTEDIRENRRLDIVASNHSWVSLGQTRNYLHEDRYFMKNYNCFSFTYEFKWMNRN